MEETLRKEVIDEMAEQSKLIIQVTKAVLTDDICDLIAENQHKLFTCYIKAGFTREEAIKLLCASNMHSHK